ncbi:MAG: sulfatase/phosphatase domain-containing protein [Candidatus Hodarchaeota archaeon]
MKEHLEYNSPKPKTELYDLINDPMEVNNLAEDPQYQLIRQELEKKLLDWLNLTNDPILSENVYSMK